MVIYGCGLRVSEAVNLRMRDIDSPRKSLHIRHYKNRTERYVILPNVVYKTLQLYWKHCRFTDYLFPGKKTGKPITTGTAATIFKRAKKQAGITKEGGIHSLRHGFATHSLESGVDLFTIKTLLGHSSIQSTVRYLRFAPCKDTRINSPIEQLSL